MSSQTSAKQTYHRPHLTVYGNIAHLTQAVSDVGAPDGAGMSAIPNRTL